MGTVEQIIAAIGQLNIGERAELDRRMGWEFDEWDEQMAADSKAGKLDKLLQEVDEDMRAGRLRDLP